jgi:hypothetical protein
VNRVYLAVTVPKSCNRTKERNFRELAREMREDARRLRAEKF